MNTVIDNSQTAVENILKELITGYPALETVSSDLMMSYNIIKNCFFNDKILFICGNGGSGCDSEHIAGELLKGFLKKRPVSEDFRKKLSCDPIADKLQCGLRTISLLSHPGLASAFSNDVDAELVYAQQLFALGREGDVVLGITTSGNARNIYDTFKVAGAVGIKTILLTGNRHGKCEELADCSIKVPASETFKVQEYHLPVYHALCRMLEDTFYEK